MHNQHQDLVWFKKCLAHQDLVKKLNTIKLIITDIDGSLTDGNLAYTAEQETSRRFSTEDGFAIVKAIKANILIAFLSGKGHGSISIRARILGIPEDLCIGGRSDKLVVIQEIQKKYEILDSEVLIFGDDHYDAVVKKQNSALMLAVPLNAPFYYHNFADIVVPRNGGDHAYRRLLDLILYIQGKHFDQDLITQALQ